MNHAGQQHRHTQIVQQDGTQTKSNRYTNQYTVIKLHIQKQDNKCQ